MYRSIRSFLCMCLGCMCIVASGPAHSNTVNPVIWNKMASSCIYLLSSQNTDALTILGDVTVAPDPMHNSITLTTVKDADNALKLTATSVGGAVFMCIVEEENAVQNGGNDELIANWRKNQFALNETIPFHFLNFDHPSTINPVLVHCLDHDKIIVVSAFIFDTGQFKVGITDRLPSRHQNPCGYSGS